VKAKCSLKTKSRNKLDRRKLNADSTGFGRWTGVERKLENSYEDKLTCMFQNNLLVVTSSASLSSMLKLLTGIGFEMSAVV
jgi:hypothetical protein